MVCQDLKFQRLPRPLSLGIRRGNPEVSQVRLSLIGVICMACGVAGRVVFATLATSESRLSGVTQACVLAPFFAVGLVLLSVPLIRHLYTGNELTWLDVKRDLVGCAMLALGMLVAWISIVAGL